MPKDEIIYREPANIFVAKYIGEPEINIVKASLLREKKDIFIELSDNIKFKLSEKKKERLKDYDNKDIYFGIRSEDIVELDSKTKKDFKSYSSYVAEKKGETKVNSEKYDILKIGKTEFVADQKRKVKKGDKIEFIINIDRCHIFDRKSEENVARDFKLIHFTK